MEIYWAYGQLAVANAAWGLPDKLDTPSHAVDMYSQVVGTAHDCSMLIDALPAKFVREREEAAAAAAAERRRRRKAKRGKAKQKQPPKAAPEA